MPRKASSNKKSVRGKIATKSRTPQAARRKSGLSSKSPKIIPLMERRRRPAQTRVSSRKSHMVRARKAA